MTGVLNVYKEKGYTSHDVVAIIRRETKIKRIGHTGTLDPDATGVLPICIGPATKFAQYITSADKTYITEVILGIETNTCDISGEVIAKKDVNFDKNAISHVVNSFATRGEYMQVPPMFSAIKIGGKKLYELARKGETLDIPARPVSIRSIKILDFLPQKYAFTIEVECSKGTYIRSLAADIGRELGCGATMGELERTQSGKFVLSTAKKLDEIKIALQNGLLRELIIPVDELLPYPKIYVSEQELKLAINGNPLPINNHLHTKVWVCSSQKLIGLYANDGKKLRPEVML